MKLFYLALMALCFCVSAKQSPNIILIVADDMGYGELGCTGHPIFKTPVLDQMAKDGATYRLPFQWRRLLSNACGINDG